MFNWTRRTKKRGEAASPSPSPTPVLDRITRTPTVTKPSVIKFANDKYGIRRTKERGGGYEFLDLVSAEDGREYWWSPSDRSYAKNCDNKDLLAVRTIFLNKTYLSEGEARKARIEAAKTADVGYEIELDVETAEYKLSGKHKT